VNTLDGRVTGLPANFQFKRSKNKVAGRQKPPENYTFRTVWYFNSLQTPEKLGSWGDGRTSCRHSAPTSLLAHFCSADPQRRFRIYPVTDPEKKKKKKYATNYATLPTHARDAHDALCAKRIEAAFLASIARVRTACGNDDLCGLLR